MFWRYFGDAFNGKLECIASTTFSADDQYIVTGSCDSTVRVWEAVSGGQLPVLYQYSAGLRRAIYNFTGTPIAACATNIIVDVLYFDLNKNFSSITVSNSLI